jgi:arsenical pump membrane protein
MSNAGSLFLPGSNLTNLIVLSHADVSGARFLAGMWAGAVAAAGSTAVVILASFWRANDGAGEDHYERSPLRLRVGLVSVAAATVLVVVVAAPALPVLGVGVAAVLLSRTPRARILAAVDVRALVGLFAVAVLLGGLGRWWRGPENLLGHVGRWTTAPFAAAAAVVVNNLPASVLLTPHAPPHARALLVGLNLGPNLAVTGSLSALLWLRVARSLGASPSARLYSLLGLVVVPVSIAAALAALSL